MSLTALERETVITFNDGEDWAEIYTAQRPWITKLKKNPAATLVEEGTHDGTRWARFKLDRGLVSLRSKRMTGRSSNGGSPPRKPGLQTQFQTKMEV